MGNSLNHRCVRLFGCAIVLCATSCGWAADEPPLSAPKVRQAPPRVLGVRMQKSAVPSEIVQTSYHFPADWRDAMADQCEQLRPVPRAHTYRKMHEVTRLHSERCGGWLLYIRGEGPAFWVRDGYEPYDELYRQTVIKHSQYY